MQLQKPFLGHHKKLQVFLAHVKGPATVGEPAVTFRKHHTLAGTKNFDFFPPEPSQSFDPIVKQSDQETQRRRIPYGDRATEKQP